MNRIKEKNPMIISTGTGKKSDETHFQSWLKTLNKLGLEMEFLNLLKDLLKNKETKTQQPCWNTGEVLKDFPLKSGTR